MSQERFLQYVAENNRPTAKVYLETLETEKIPFLVRGLIFTAILWAGGFLIWILYLLGVSVWAGGVLLTALGWILTYKLKVKGILSRCAVSYLGILCTIGGQMCLTWAFTKVFKQDEYALVLVAGLSYPFFKSTWNRLFWGVAASCALFVVIEHEPFAVLVQLGFISFGISFAIFLMRVLNLYPLAYSALFFTGLIWGSQMTDIAYGWVFIPLAMSAGVYYAGFVNYDRLLEYTGVGCLIASLFFVYYNMTLPLSLKSLPLILTGCLLMVIGGKYAK